MKTKPIPAVPPWFEVWGIPTCVGPTGQRLPVLGAPALWRIRLTVADAEKEAAQAFKLGWAIVAIREVSRPSCVTEAE